MPGKRFEMWCWRRKQKIIWTNRVRNEEVLNKVKEKKKKKKKKNILHKIKRRKAGLVTSCVDTGKDISDRETRKKM
jgi:hypothetical protein